MSYQELNQYNSPNYTPQAQVPAVYGRPRVVKYITIHWWGDPAQNPQFMGIVNYLCRENGNTSAHVVAEAGRVAWIVNGYDAAWHAGNAVGNAESIGIECNPRAWDSDYQTIGELVRDIRKIYGDVPLRRHSDWTNTGCPGVYDINRIDAIARGQVSTPAPVVPASTPKPAPKPASGATTIQRSENEIHWVVEPGDSLSKICNYYYGEASPATVNKVAAYNGIANPSLLSVGQKVWIPGPMAWAISDYSDTVQSICNYYGISWEWLAARNPNQVSGPDTELYIGNVLRII